MSYKIDLDFTYLFSRSLKEMSPNFDFMDTEKKLNKTLNKLWDDKYNVTYKHNSYGYRCNEFKNQEIVFLGCSNTYGMGLEINHTWPYLLSEKLGIDYINLGKGGDSAQAQVIKAFQFFKEFYNPKYIFALLPIFRAEFPKVNNILDKNTKTEKPIILQHFFDNDHKHIKKIFQTPYNLDEILPREVPVFYSFMFIQMLIEYCNSNNIKLFWTTYDINSDDIKHLLNLKKENEPFGLNFFHKNDLKNETCHFEFKDYKDFNIAADKGHVGFHYHIHLAELLYSLMV